MAEAAAIGAKTAVVFSSGFAEAGDEGKALQRRLVAVIGDSGLRVLGPNCIGVMNVPERSYGTFQVALESGTAPAGGVGVAVQSGAMGSHLLTLARKAGIGLGPWAATGNEADIDVADVIAWMARDPGTRVIVCCLEACGDAARFRAALALARIAGKPVLVLKIGASDVGKAAAASHTGMLAGNDAVFDAVLRQEGALRVESLEALLEIAYVADHAAQRGFSRERAARGRLGVVTLSGGAGVLLADVAAKVGLTLPELPRDAQRAILDLVPFAGPRNPVDTTAQVNVAPELLDKCLDIALRSGDFDFLVLFITGVPYSRDLGNIYLRTLRRARKRYPETLMVMSAIAPDAYRRRVERAGCLYIEDPTRAGIALGCLKAIADRHLGAATGGAPTVRVSDFPAIPRAAIDETEAKRVLAGAGIPVMSERLVTSADDAAAAASEVGFPVAMKIVSPDIAHKTEIGGVLLDVANADDVRRGYAALRAAAAEKAPAARVTRRRGRADGERGRRDDPRRRAGSGVRTGGDVRARRRVRRDAARRDLPRRAVQPRGSAPDDRGSEGQRAAPRHAWPAARGHRCARGRARRAVPARGSAARRFRRDRHQPVPRAAGRARCGRARCADHSARRLTGARSGGAGPPCCHPDGLPLVGLLLHRLCACSAADGGWRANGVQPIRVGLYPPNRGEENHNTIQRGSECPLHASLCPF